MLQDAYIQAGRAHTFLLEFYNDYDGLIWLAVGAVLILLLLGFTLHKGKKQPHPGEDTKMVTKGEYVLSKREQRQRENNVIADEVESFLLKLFTDGKITEERYQYWHLRFGTQLALKDLLPVKLTPEQLKKAMTARRTVAKYKPIPFPKETPKKKKQNALEVALQKHLIVT